MKAYKLEVLIVDHDNLGGGGIITELENTRFANDCINLDVMAIEEADIGEWDDDHPLNCYSTRTDEYYRLFPEPLPLNGA
jgi:hypothetical protein